jgi:molybdopterin molybdotransferase
MISVAEAQAVICAAAKTSDAEAISLDDALARTLAAPVVAIRDQPPFDASAMDGYAFAAAEHSLDLQIIGEAAAGHPYLNVLLPGQAVRISTGAAMPDGANTVLIQEDAVRDGDRLIGVLSGRGANVRSRGGDFSHGVELLPTGRGLSAGDLMLAASAGSASVCVRRRPRIAILSGGDEITEPGTEASTAQIFESSSFGVAALARSWGAQARRSPPLRDAPTEIAAAVDAELGECDALVLIGGASVGPHDHARGTLARMGIHYAFEKVAVRPGKPTWFGELAGKPILGLPGNPASAMVCARLFLVPLIEATLAPIRPSALKPVTATLTRPVAANGSREHYRRASLHWSDAATLQVTPFEDQDSSRSTIVSESDGLLMQLPHTSSLAIGDRAEFLPWSSNLMLH